MQQKISHNLLAGLLLLCLLLATEIMFSSYQNRRAGNEVWKMLGVSKESGTDEIRNSFLSGYFSYYSARNAKNLAINDRAAIARDLLVYTKQYISSAGFKKKYDSLRSESKPVAPEARKVRSKEKIQKEEIAKIEQSLQEMEESLKTAKPDLVKVLEPMVAMLRQTSKDYRDPNNQTFQLIADSDKSASESNATDYKENILQWQSRFPADVKQFIKARLQIILELTAGIDYQAALTETSGRKRFVNPEFENKQAEWKQGFRAGKEMTETVRTFIQQWLAELK